MMLIFHGVSLSHQDKFFHGSLLFQDNKVTGRKADVMMAAYMAAEAALRLVKPGNEVSPLFSHPLAGHLSFLPSVE